jgi:trimeric autotransporter adhesin
VKDANGAVVTDRVVSWRSSNALIATVSQAGVVTGVAPGTATITATSETKSANATITVTLVPVSDVQVDPPTVSIPARQTATLTATLTDANGTVLTNRPVTWSTSDARVATVSQAGVVTGVAAGTATISAKSGAATGTSAITVTPPPVQSVTVSPSTLSLTQGQTGSLSATVVDVTGATVSSPSVAWSSKDPAIATVDPNTGVVTAVAVGSTTIDATSGGKTGSSTVTVGPPPIVSVTISPSSSNVTAGQTISLTATVTDALGTAVTSSTVAWTSDDAQIADPQSTGTTTANVTTSKAGTATITASVGGVQGTATITVDPGAVTSVNVSGPSNNLKPGSTMQLTADALDTQRNVVPNQSFFWSSSNPIVATVSSSGLVSGERRGNVTITAFTTLIGGLSGFFAIDVK